jgi:hypothetical protein
LYKMGQIIIKEQIIPDTPPTDYHAIFVDTADGIVKKKNDAGVVSSLEPPVVSVFGRSGAVVSVSGDYTASEITNVTAGGLSATTVQAAINELDTEKAPATHVGSNGVSQHAVADGSNAGFLSASDFTKLSGIASGATANSPDATLLARANHTGTQTASTISDFQEAAQDATASALASGTHDGISFAYNDAGDAISATNTNKGSTAVTAHEALADPHTQYTTEAEAIVIALVFG